jgi:hypothetical protein
MNVCSSLLMCFDEDESTTSQISRTDGSILICDARKLLPMRKECISDAIASIGTDLGLRQACYEDGKLIFRNCSMMMLTRVKYVPHCGASMPFHQLYLLTHQTLPGNQFLLLILMIEIIQASSSSLFINI